MPEDDSKSGKGRKRKQVTESKNIKDIIENWVMPQWVSYLRKKQKSREGQDSGLKPRDDTIWKKIFRDLREFFRILFKLRFHPLDYKSCEQADNCCKIILNDLGVDTEHVKTQDFRKIFYYFHQTRLNSSDHYMSNQISKDDDFWMEIIEKYKDSLKSAFMADPIASRMFYFVFYNFDYVYTKFIKEKYQETIGSIIQNCLETYEQMAENKDYVSVVRHLF